MNNYVIKNSDALLITDMQNDFLPGGALPINDGDEIIPVLNEYIDLFESTKANVLASRDWHPVNHISFKSMGGQWPPHCVQYSIGAKFNSRLKLPKHIIVISKAMNPEHEAYSAFDGTSLAHELKTLGVNRLFIGGLATDYCVLHTTLDSIKLGYETVVLMDATLGINLNPGDVDRAIETMVKNGAQQATVADFPDAVDNNLPIEKMAHDILAEKTSLIAEEKKKARMRSRGSSKIRTEKG